MSDKCKDCYFFESDGDGNGFCCFWEETLSETDYCVEFKTKDDQ